jgi:glycosyltransferase involved in cell wall biosynthesis
MNSSKPTLSVVVITKNEESDLPRCLRSVWFADEIVVLDSGSTDRTVEIAREFTDKVFVSDDWPGFGPQKNRALSHATGDWVLSLDADEWVTPVLASEIEERISQNRMESYRIPRSSSLCGHIIRHSGWSPDYVLRLFKRGSATFSEDLVHEKVITQAPTKFLNHPLRHESYKKIDDVVRKISAYASAGAENRARKGETTTFSKALLSSAWAFLRTYILRLGLLDGRQGFILAAANSHGAWYRHLMLLEKKRRNKTSVALVISTYNRPDALNKVLISVASQEVMPDEIIIADDGSEEETRQLIEAWQRRLHIKHVWQEDIGFRLSAARNNAIKVAQSDYIIFIDGDCLIPSDFIKKHLKMAEPRFFVPGSRILLTESITRSVLREDGMDLQRKSFAQFVVMRLKGEINRLVAFLFVPGKKWRKWRTKSWRRIRGCNMAFWRDDLLHVNGFDEDFDHWGHEDADIAVRLIRSGVYRKDGIMGSYVFHLWHRENKDASEQTMLNYLSRTIVGERPVFAEHGIQVSDGAA